MLGFQGEWEGKEKQDVRLVCSSFDHELLPERERCFKTQDSGPFVYIMWEFQMV
jgi:hypothetical protein